MEFSTSASLPQHPSHAVVDVLDADDVVLAEIGAGLHLDQLQIDLAGIGEPVDDADRQDRSTRSRAPSWLRRRA